MSKVKKSRYFDVDSKVKEYLKWANEVGENCGAIAYRDVEGDQAYLDALYIGGKNAYYRAYNDMRCVVADMIRDGKNINDLAKYLNLNIHEL
jgi:hypothetical protein